jgi:hypothetical protein
MTSLRWRRMPGACGRSFVDAGHALLPEQPQRIARVIINYLRN